jgi:hypothetical protein
VRGASRGTTSRSSISFARLDKKHASLLTVFDRLRRKRNLALYDDTGFVSHHDAEQALESAHRYLEILRADVTVRKP